MNFDPPSPIPTNIDFLLIQPLEKKNGSAHGHFHLAAFSL